MIQTANCFTLSLRPSLLGCFAGIILSTLFPNRGFLNKGSSGGKKGSPRVSTGGSRQPPPSHRPATAQPAAKLPPENPNSYKIALVLHWLYFSESELFGKSIKIALVLRWLHFSESEFFGKSIKIALVLHWLYFSESEFFGKSMNIRSGASLATL